VTTLEALLKKPSLRKVIEDPVEFISRLQIIDKAGKRVELRPNGEQLKIIEVLGGSRDVLIFKGRQIGSTTVCCSYMFWKAYTSREPVTLATMSHKASSARHLLSIIKRFHDALPISMRREWSVDNGGELRFADTGAGFIAVSTEGKGGLRSFSCNFCHISEFAFADNPDELKATAIAALNGGKMVIETTANRWGDGLHKEWSRCERGESDWERLFFPWWKHAAYAIPFPDETRPAWRADELLQQERWDLTDEQLNWRRQTIGKLGPQKFRREYPASTEEAYSAAGTMYFREEDFAEVEILNVDDAHWTVYDERDEADAYAIGVDVAAGVGKDWSVIYVLSKLTGSPVAVWRSNTVEPVKLADHIIDIATEWGRARVLVEGNNYGGVVLNQMRHLGWDNIWKSPEGRDWQTTLKSKTMMFEKLKADIQAGRVRHLDKLTYDELRTIAVSERGNIELGREADGHCDSAVALALANVCLDGVRLSQRHHLPDWIRKNRVQRIVDRYGARIAEARRYT